MMHRIPRSQMEAPSSNKVFNAVTMINEVTESQSLLAGTSVQKTEIITLTRGLELAKGKRINIWTDSKYACGVVHTHGAI